MNHLNELKQLVKNWSKISVKDKIAKLWSVLASLRGTTYSSEYYKEKAKKRWELQKALKNAAQNGDITKHK